MQQVYFVYCLPSYPDQYLVVLLEININVIQSKHAARDKEDKNEEKDKHISVFFPWLNDKQILMIPFSYIYNFPNYPIFHHIILSLHIFIFIFLLLQNMPAVITGNKSSYQTNGWLITRANVVYVFKVLMLVMSGWNSDDFISQNINHNQKYPI